MLSGQGKEKNKKNIRHFLKHVKGLLLNNIMTIHSINDIMSHIIRNFPAKGYLYEVRITGGGVHADAAEEITFNCSSISTPGANLQHTPVRKFGIGLPSHMPIGRSFTEMTLSFYESENEQEREYFVEWQNKIYDPETKRFGFYKDFVKTLAIIQFDKKLNKTYEVRCENVWPSNISPLDRSYESDGMKQFNVNMQFHDVEEIFYDNRNGKRIFPSLRS